MGETQSKPLGSQQQSPPKRPTYTNTKTSYSLAAQQQGEQLSPEEVRRARLARMEKEEYVPDRGLPKDIKSHPIALEFGSNAYLIHMNLEDLYLNTFHPSSLSRNPRLKLLQAKDPSEEIRLYSLENVDQTIMTFLQSEAYFPGGAKLTYLSDLYGRITANDHTTLFSEETSQELQKKLVTNLMDRLLNPSSCDPNTLSENPRVLTDCSSSIYDAFYNKLSSLDQDGFFSKFIGQIPEENYDAILTPIFKRMIRNSSQNTLSGRFDIQKAIALLSDLLQCDPKIAEFFFNHELFLPSTLARSGQGLQNNTIFGSFLSFTIMNNDSPSMHQVLTTRECLCNLEPPKQELRDKLHDPLNSFHRLIESIIKLNPTKYKKNITDWFTAVLHANRKIDINTSGPQHKLATFGWLSNFFVILLKLCQKMLEDPSKYPNWLAKIDLTYASNKSLFEGKTLMNGKSIVSVKDPSPVTYSFLTELIFMASQAWTLFKKAFLKIREITPNISLIYQTNPRLENLKDSEVDIIKTFVAYRVHFLDPYLTRKLHSLLDFQALLILQSFGVKIQDLSDIPALFEQSLDDENPDNGGVLVEWAANITNFLDYYAIIEQGAFAEGYDNLEINMNFMLWILVNKKWTSYPNIITMILFVYNQLLPDTQAKSFQTFTFLFKNNHYYALNLVKGLTQAYIGAKECCDGYYLQRERLRVMQTFNDILEVIFATEKSTCYVIKSLTRLFTESTDLYFEFMDAFIEELGFLLDNMFAILRKKGQNPTSYRSIVTHEGSRINLIEESADGVFSLLFVSLKNHLTLMNTLSTENPEFLVNDLMRERFAAKLNYLVKKFSTEGIFNSKIPQGLDAGAGFECILFKIINLYWSHSQNSDFIKSMKNDEQNFNSCYFSQIQVFFMENPQLLTFVNIEGLSQMIANLDV